MPTYEYRCKTCEAQFEIVQSFSAKTLTKCPKKNGPEACVSPGKGEVAKVFAAPGITFKGEGFYKTDSSSSGSVKADGTSESDATVKKSDSSSDKSSDASKKDTTKKSDSTVKSGSTGSGSSD